MTIEVLAAVLAESEELALPSREALQEVKEAELERRKTDENLSAVLYGAHDLRLEHKEVAAPAKGEVLIRVQSVGICGSDVHFWHLGGIGPFVPDGPFVLGHESSGIVEAVGKGVTHLQKGDRIAIEPGVPCRSCEQCLGGTYNLCPKVDYLSVPPYDGALRRHMVHPADFCFKLPPKLSFEDGAFLEPLSVAIHSVRRACIDAGKNVFVAGAGPIGLLCLLAAKAFGAARVILSDINESRLELAKKLGADGTINVAKLSPEEAAAAIRVHFDGREPEASIECTGADSAGETCILATRPGGTLVLVGLGRDRRNLPLQTAFLRELDIRGAHRMVNTYPTAIRLLDSGRIDLSGLTRAHYPLEQSVEAFERNVKADVAKVFIKCNNF